MRESHGKIGRRKIRSVEKGRAVSVYRVNEGVIYFVRKKKEREMRERERERERVRERERGGERVRERGERERKRELPVVSPNKYLS